MIGQHATVNNLGLGRTVNSENIALVFLFAFLAFSLGRKIKIRND